VKGLAKSLPAYGFNICRISYGLAMLLRVSQEWQAYEPIALVFLDAFEHSQAVVVGSALVDLSIKGRQSA
jgi:hypothetical protein